jgi:uncharacterized protein
LRRDRLPADGFSSTEVLVRNTAGERVAAEVTVVEGQRIARIEAGRVWATVNPGRAVIEARYPGRKPARSVLVTNPVYSDRAADGTPDFLRLDDLADRQAFADLFAYLAEIQYAPRRDALPGEIKDCSALIRYAYRETLREEAASAHAQPVKYRYPFTPLGPRLFRTTSGPFRESDLRDQTFSEFADAETLRRYNTYFISRDVLRAKRGDLLFYRQPDQRSPAHAMIFLAESQIEENREKRVVYHTGPSGSDKGEIRRPTIDELLHHPEPRWRPLSGNSNFLGVYRWNILKQES